MKVPKNAGGGGAPIRSASGRLLTYLREDPMISFNSTNKRHVDNMLRYKTTPEAQRTYKQQLDRIVAERAKLERIREMPNEEFDDQQFVS
jgi:transcription initiation factor IIE alpha subunit